RKARTAGKEARSQAVNRQDREPPRRQERQEQQSRPAGRKQGPESGVTWRALSGLLAQAFRPGEGGRDPRFGGFSLWGFHPGAEAPSRRSGPVPGLHNSVQR